MKFLNISKNSKNIAPTFILVVIAIFYASLYIFIITGLFGPFYEKCVINLNYYIKEDRIFFEDKYFRRILNAFKRYSNYIPLISPASNIKFKQGTIPTFLLVTNNVKPPIYWENQFHHISSNECPLPCNYTRDINEASNVDAILIHLDALSSRDSLETSLGVRDLTQPWVMFTFETPFMANKTFNFKYNELDSLFNRTMTYRQDSDILVTHGFVVSKDDALLLPYHWRIPPEHLKSIYIKPAKTVIGTLISNCKDTSGRLHYITELQNYIDVDIYGECGKLKCGYPLYVAQGYKPVSEVCIKRLGRLYKFYLAFENSYCKDYGTEKIYNLLFYPIVPIVYGGIKYEDILPPNSYINAAEFSPFELAEYVRFLVTNPHEYNKYFKWKEYYIPSTIGGERIACDLCTTLHDPEFYKNNIIENFYNWFVTESECRVYRIPKPDLILEVINN